MSSISIAEHQHIVDTIVRTYDRDLDIIRRQLNMKCFQVIVFLLTTLIGLFSTFFWATKFYEHDAELVDMRRFVPKYHWY